jgi:hypothetical protein
MKYRHLTYGTATLLVCAGWYWCGTAVSDAAEVVMKDGTTFKGAKLVIESTVGVKTIKQDADQSPNKCIIKLEEAEAVRIYVPVWQAASQNKDNDLRGGDDFQIPLNARNRKDMIAAVGGMSKVTPFNEFGIRMATFKLPNNKPLNMMQQITELHPKYVKVSATDYLWEFGLPTSSLPAPTLHTLLRLAAKPDTADSRFTIVRFCLEGGFYPLADYELGTISKDFPNREKDVKVQSQRLKQYLADEAVRLLEERRAAGQHGFAQLTARQFLALDLPDIGAATIQTLQKAVTKGEETLSQLEEVRQLLGQLQADLPKEQAAEVAPIRKMISEELNIDTLDRLQPFFNLSDAENRKSDEKLALALSGWALGSDQALTSLPQALRLWQARGIVQKYLRADSSPERAAALVELEKLEGIGHKQVVRMLSLLPPRMETPDVKASEPFEIEIPATAERETTAKYEVLLPPEYHHGRSYPLIVALHEGSMVPRAELGWWARQAQRLGYIVVAPTYMPGNQTTYDYSVRAHRAVLDTIRDAKRRFTIDSDHVFLGGHGRGGDAAFDIGFSHPDLFAGVIPITATLEKFSRVYRDNAKTLPLFILAGELDRDCLVKNAPDINKMMEQHIPVVYAVFNGRGAESFQSEDARLFDWMSHQVRAPLPTKIDVATVRTTDNQFWWWTFSNFPARFGITAWPENVKANAVPMTIYASAAKAKGANVLNLNCGARWHALWLFPEVVSFEKTLTIRQADQQLYRAIPEPNISASLEDFRLRCDRQRIAWAYLEIGNSIARPMVHSAGAINGF